MRKLFPILLLVFIATLLGRAGQASAAVTTPPAAPTHSGQDNTPTLQVGGAARALVVRGGVAFVGQGPRLHVVDLNHEPLIAAVSPPLAANIEALAIAGEYAYLAAGPAGLAIISLNDSQSPAVVSTLPEVDYAVGVAVAGNGLYLAGAEGVVGVFDITHAAAPQQVAELRDLGQVTGVAVDNGFLLVARGHGGLSAFRLDEGPLPLPTSAITAPALSLSAAGGLVYVGSDFTGGVQLLSLDHFGRLAPIGAASTASLVTDAVALEIGSHAYVALALAGGGWSLLDLATPSAPTLLLNLPLPGAATATSFENGRLYLLDENSGLRWYDMANPTQPEPSGSYRVPGVVTRVVDGESGLLALDTTGLNLLTPAGELSDSMSLPGTLQDLARVGDVAYVAAGLEGIHVIELTGGSALRRVATLDAVGDVTALAQGAGQLYAGLRDGRLQAFDLATPRLPQAGAALSLEQPAYDIAVRDQRMAIADWQGVQLLDLSDPAFPQPAGRVETNGYATGVTLGAGVAFVADWSGVQVVDTTNPYAPQLLTPIALPGHIVDVALGGDWLYVAGGLRGVHLLRVDAAHALQYYATYGSPGYAAGVAPHADGVLLADRSGGLLSFSGPLSSQLFLPLAVGQ